MPSEENFIIRVKTAAITIIMSSGLRTLHATPRKLRRYLILKSRLTNCRRIYPDFLFSGYHGELSTDSSSCAKTKTLSFQNRSQDKADLPRASTAIRPTSQSYSYIPTKEW